ncbi:MAG: type II toxin-antitoxin system ParD family antitoxin [Terriglobia bacterium]|jgi:antitoxin ParD1/3/4
MNANVGPVLENFVTELLESGLYQSQSEVLREGLRLLKEREDLKRLRLDNLRKEIALGSRQADRGEFLDGPVTFRQIRRRRAARHTS